jgi:hypothetical protein
MGTMRQADDEIPLPQRVQRVQSKKEKEKEKGGHRITQIKADEQE